jgi:predicted amidohydrolase YtcJ
VGRRRQLRVDVGSRRVFDARWLDEAVADRPVVLRAWDYHTLWVNSEALRRAGIDDATPDPALGRVVRRPDGSAMGTLQEWGAVNLVLDVCPPRAPEDRVTAIEIATRTLAASGVTWVQDAWAEEPVVEDYLRAAAEDRLHCRVNLALLADPATGLDKAQRHAALRARVRAAGFPRLSAETIKLFVDGVVENHKAHMLAPYADRPDDRGLPNWTDAQLREAVAAYDVLGFQCHLHAIGDAAVRSALDAIEHAERANGPRDGRHVVAHLQVMGADDVARFARHGIIANFEPLWAHVDPAMEQLHLPRLGPRRSQRQYVIGEMLRSGAQVSFGSD